MELESFGFPCSNAFNLSFKIFEICYTHIRQLLKTNFVITDASLPVVDVLKHFWEKSRFTLEPKQQESF